MNKKTDKKLASKGIKFLLISLSLMLICPIIIHSAFKNQEHNLYLPILSIGIILAILAIATAFYGIKTLIDSIFGKK